MKKLEVFVRHLAIHLIAQFILMVILRSSFSAIDELNYDAHVGLIAIVSLYFATMRAVKTKDTDKWKNY